LAKLFNVIESASWIRKRKIGNYLLSEEAGARGVEFVLSFVHRMLCQWMIWERLYLNIQKKCNGCGMCELRCPDLAIELE